MRIPFLFALAAGALFAAGLLGPGLPGSEGSLAPSPALFGALVCVEVLFLSWACPLAPRGTEGRASGVIWTMGLPAGLAAARIGGEPLAAFASAEALLLVPLAATVAWGRAERSLGRDLGGARAALLFAAQAGPVLLAFLVEACATDGRAGAADGPFLRGLSPWFGITAAASGATGLLGPFLFVQGIPVAVALLLAAFGRGAPATAGSR